MLSSLHALRYCFPVPVLLVLACGQYCAAQVPAEAIAGWQEMERAVKCIQIQYRYEDGQGDLQISCATQGDLSKVEFSKRSKRSKAPSREAYVRNDLGFSLKEYDGLWQLSRVRQADEPFPAISKASETPRIGFSIQAGLTLLEMLENENYRVILWRPTGDQDGIVEMVVSCSAEDRIFHKANLILEPNKRFRMRKIGYFTDRDVADAEYEFSYDDSSELHQIVPASWKLPNSNKNWTVTAVSDERLPDSDFTLAYYGLPDYVSQRDGGYWLWASLGGALLSALVLLRSWRKLQRRA